MAAFPTEGAVLAGDVPAKGSTEEDKLARLSEMAKETVADAEQRLRNAYTEPEEDLDLDLEETVDEVARPAGAGETYQAQPVAGVGHAPPIHIDVDKIPNYASERAADFSRVVISHPQGITESDEVIEVFHLLRIACRLRDKYEAASGREKMYEGVAPSPSAPYTPFDATMPPKDESTVFRMLDGVIHVYQSPEAPQPQYSPPELSEYFKDLTFILRVAASGPVKSYCYQRLCILEARFNLHMMLNSGIELMAQKRAPHRDFYNVRKVDTHVHHSSSMNQKHLLRFIKTRLRAPEAETELVIHRDGKDLTLKQVFESLNLTPYDLSVDSLDVHADKHTFNRFDKFNLKYNPIGESRLRELFLKTDNMIKGRYLAQITQEIFDDLKSTKYQMAEYRISIYGRSPTEWDKLAKWICNNKLYSDNVRWLIQVPRLYTEYKVKNLVDNFQTMLSNIFTPLFEVTKNPETHPELFQMLQQVVGFDCVDDESKPEVRVHRKYPVPAEWNNDLNPPFTYYLYYMYANLATLNHYRESLGLNTFRFRPHSGEAGDVDHIASSYLLAHNINHGITLRKSPAIQYLFYLKQIGIAMSPLSNNSLFLDYSKNPFPLFFARGLNVSLSTDDPLQFHFTKEPLIEEYSIAAQVFKLSACDQCEIARNSVLQSGFEHPVKAYWLGESYTRPGFEGNDINRTNVPNVRLMFRQETLQEELGYIMRASDGTQHEQTPPMSARGVSSLFVGTAIPDLHPTNVAPSPRPKSTTPRVG